MNIKLVESSRKFSEENIQELERFLSRLPYPHLQSLNHVERVVSLGGKLAVSSPEGCGEEITLSDGFYDLDPAEREYAFLHEMGHNYFDFIDENEGDRSFLKWGPCEKEDVAHLLRVQWIDLGLWGLDLENWEKVKALNPGSSANRDKYTYIVMYKNPNYRMGEWVCPLEARIPKNSFQYGFRYDQPFYSPKEEMGDAYALFVLERDHFLISAEASNVIKAKYKFIQKHFTDNSRGVIKLVR